MRLSLRSKLVAIVATAAGAFVVMIVSGEMIAHRAEHQLEIIRDHYIPRVEIAPQLETQFDHLRRGLQDAVAARDGEMLAATQSQLDGLLRTLDEARNAVNPNDAWALRQAVGDYYKTAMGVSRRLMAGETGASLLEAMTAMQVSQTRTAECLKRAVSFDRGELTTAFATAARAEVTAGRVRLATTVACLMVVVFLSLWLGRGVLRSLVGLTGGLQRFGQGDFARPIPILDNDELGDLAKQANQMAEDLRTFAERRDHADWLKGTLVGFANELRGQLDPAEVARRAVTFLARTLDAQVAALYVADTNGVLRVLGSYALAAAGPGEVAAGSFRPGEGLVGQAALRTELTIITDPPPNYLRIRSGLGEGAPRSIALVPLPHLERVTGVVELACFSEWRARSTEVLLSLRESLTIALEVAQARSAMRDLLGETQRQTILLTEQEEELRATNDELQAQQEKLLQTNQELTDQAIELEDQRRQLEQNNTELTEARRSLEEKAAELSQISAYKSQFLTNMSHELRTPLNSMLLLSNLLAENQPKNLTEKQIEFATTIHIAGKDLLSLINQVLDLAKIEAGKHEIHIGRISLRRIVTNLRLVFEPLAHEKGLDFVVEMAADLPDEIVTDRQRVEQILKNLLGNAIKFTERGRVALHVGRPDSAMLFQRDDLKSERSVAFAVSDTGVGVSPTNQKRIFGRFEQVEGSPDRKFGGTGLGLSISRELATLLGGELRLDSVLGRGSTFTCILPFEHGESHADDGQSPTETGSAEDDAPPSKGRRSGGPSDLSVTSRATDACLLIVEDDPIFAGVLADIVRGFRIEPLVAPDGRTGLRLARERHPSGIVLDVRLPDIDGWRVMEELRAERSTAGIPVHFVSAFDAPEQGVGLGAVGFLTKPASPNELHEVIASLVSRTRDRGTRLLVVEDDVTVGDSLVKLLSGENLEVRRASRADEALRCLEEERFSCLILDLTLPDMDGLEFLRLIRERYAEAMPAVVVYTARALSKAEIHALEAYTEAIVLKEGASSRRLVDEVRLFVRRLKEGVKRDRKVASTGPLSAAIDLKGRTILLVDDDMRTVYALSAILRATGAQVLTADTSEGALALLNSPSDVEAILMDIMMPSMDGYEAMRRIRADHRFREVLMVALTAKAMVGEAQRCLDAGANDYLAKPVDAERLLTLLTSRLGKGPHGESGSGPRSKTLSAEG